MTQNEQATYIRMGADQSGEEVTFELNGSIEDLVALLSYGAQEIPNFEKVIEITYEFLQFEKTQTK